MGIGEWRRAIGVHQGFCQPSGARVKVDLLADVGAHQPYLLTPQGGIRRERSPTAASTKPRARTPGASLHFV
ncbi:hypothetical protein NRF20_43715 [Streptomyces sp. R-74717]|uniref:hypothetical protein n=1 Tax=Streptomyces sp. R-74717 TaxID=2969820 RepID=UPI0039B36E66